MEVGGSFTATIINLKYFAHHFELCCKLCFGREGKGIQSCEMLSTSAWTAKRLCSLLEYD